MSLHFFLTHYYKKTFVVSVGNTFMVSVRGTGTICTIQKINHLLYRLERTDTKNQFSKKKHYSAAAQIHVEDPAEGGGGRAQIQQREEVALGLMVTEVGKEGVGGRRLASWSPRWGRRASVGAARGRPHRRRGRSCAPPTASASPCRRRPPPPHQAQRPPCRRLPRRLSPRQNQRKERRERTE